MDLQEYVVHYRDKKVYKEVNICILIPKCNNPDDPNYCTRIPRIYDPKDNIDYRYDDLICIGDMILYKEKYHEIKDIEWIEKWNLYIQKETGNYKIYEPGDIAILGYNNQFIRGTIRTYTTLYRYTWVHNKCKFYNGRLDQNPIFRDQFYINIFDYFVVSPMKSSLLIQININNIIIDMNISNIYEPININNNNKYDSIYDFWKQYKSTIYHIRDRIYQYMDIIIVTQ